MPLTSARFTDMKTRSENYLVDTCQIEYRTETSDGAGGWSDSWTVRGAAIPCYVKAETLTRDVVGEAEGRIESYTRYTLYIASDGTIAPGDKVTHNSMVYYAQGVTEAKSRRAFLSAGLVLEATGG